MSDDGHEVITSSDCEGLIELIHHVIVLDIKRLAAGHGK